MLKYWIKAVDLDGYRCDTAGMIPTSFWEQARVELNKTKPDIMMLAEADKPELLTNAFDIDYSWPLMNTLRSVLGKSTPAYEIRDTWAKEVSRYPLGSLRLTMSDNHDQPRAVSCFGVNGALAGSALMFTLNGVPLIYNGMEVGDATESCDPALFEKVPIFWDPSGRPPLRKIYRDLIKIRKQYRAFRLDQVQWVGNSDENDLVTFLRSDDKDEFLVAVNLSSRSIFARLDLVQPDGYEPVKIRGLDNVDSSPVTKLHLKGFEWRIYHRSLVVTASK